MTAEEKKEKLSHFFHREYTKLLGFVRKRIDDTAELDAEDIVQDVILHIFDKANITAPIENLAAYIYQSLRNKIIDVFRRKKESLSLDASLLTNGLSLKDFLYDNRWDTLSEVMKNELREKMFEAIDSLRSEEKAVIMATEFDGFSFQHLAEQWDIPLGTLLARKSRALKKIQVLLKEYK